MINKSWDCRNCNHHWIANKQQESCPVCNSWYVMTTDQWDEEDALEETKFPQHSPLDA